MTWLGYLNTSGLAEMDYRISDLVADPPEAEHFHAEKLLRLPHAAWCYLPPADAPDPGHLPQLASGRTTFAALNNFAKTTPETIALWGRILAATPGSRLLVLAKDTAVAERAFSAVFEAQGIGGERLEVRPTCGFSEYLALHREVDIALDSYPYNGATTTCHALWMGVPVISLCGTYPPVSRSGASLLTTLGLGELCTATPDDYVKAAVILAGEPDTLSGLRASLREKMRQSPLTDAARFTLALESAYRSAWESACQHPSS
jgi:predicted O-linked N-acetylglucosamine transferase (SPINDLY family)